MKLINRVQDGFPDFFGNRLRC